VFAVASAAVLSFAVVAEVSAALDVVVSFPSPGLSVPAIAGDTIMPSATSHVTNTRIPSSLVFDFPSVFGLPKGDPITEFQD